MRRNHQVGRFCLCCATVFGALGIAAGVSRARAASVVVPDGHDKGNLSDVGFLRVAQDRSDHSGGRRQAGFDERNKMHNGSFEEGAKEWKNDTRCGIFSYSIDDAEHHDGTKSARIECKKTVVPVEKLDKRTAWGRWYQPGIHVEKGATYRLIAWVKTSNDFNGKLEIWFHHGIAEKGESGPTQGAWKKMVIEGIRSKSDTATVYLNVFDSTGTVWFDEITVEKTGER